MKQVSTTIVVLLLTVAVSIGQQVKLSCSDTERKNEEGKYPIHIKTCYIKNFKFITTSSPDYEGRYFFDEYEVYVKKDNKYVRTTNSSVFNKKQNELLYTINEQILKKFNCYRSDSSTKSCFTGIDSIPTYKMNDLDITFYDNEIWFVVKWGLSSVCRAVDGTIVIFKIDEIKKYLK